jgi:hypothetical protein
MRGSWQFTGCIIVLLLTASCLQEVSSAMHQVVTGADFVWTN